jgi:hypothetical protein
VVRRSTVRARVEVGDHVKVPWGLDEVEGEVVAAYDSGTGRKITVAVSIQGADDAFTVTYPASAVAPADAA